MVQLGNVTSQLFANIYLNKIDQFIKHNLKIKYYIRYCDDFIILIRDRKYLENIVRKINIFLRDNLRLNLHPNKIEIKKVVQGIDFLGYITFYYYRILRTKTKRRMLRKIKIRKNELGKGIISRKSFDQTLNSYFGILKHCKGNKMKKEIIKTILD